MYVLNLIYIVLHYIVLNHSHTYFSFRIFIMINHLIKPLQVPLNFKAFDHSIELTLHKNDKIIAPQFQVWKHSDADTLEELPELNKPILCHYLHKDNLSSAAISLCGEHGMVSIRI